MRLPGFTVAVLDVALVNCRYWYLEDRAARLVHEKSRRKLIPGVNSHESLRNAVLL